MGRALLLLADMEQWKIMEGKEMLLALKRNVVLLSFLILFYFFFFFCVSVFCTFLTFSFFLFSLFIYLFIFLQTYQGMVEINRRRSEATEKEKVATSTRENTLKKVKDLMLKVKEVDVARVKAEEEVIKLKANYETSIKQLVEAQNSAKKIVTMEKEKA